MEQNNNNITAGEYAFPQNKEQFKKVLKQAQEGRYYKQTEPEQPREKVWDKYAAYAESLSHHSDRTEQASAQQYGEKEPKAAPDYRQPSRSNKLTPVKKKFNPLVVIFPLILLIAAAAVIFFLYLNNNVSYRKAEATYLGGLLQKITDLANGSEDTCKADIRVSVPAAGLAGVNISEAALSADAVRQGETVYGLLDAVVGSESFSLESWTNPANGASTIFFPEISDIYLSIKPFGENADYSGMLKDIFGKTLETYFELTGEPEPEKNASFTVNDSSFTADKYEINLDGAQLATVKRAFLVSLLSNDAAAAALCREMGCGTKEELIEDERVKSVFDDFEQIITGEKANEDSLNMSVYVKNKTVIGRTILFNNHDENTVTVFVYEIPTDDGQLTYIYCKNTGIKESKEEEFYITCEDSGKDVHTGKITAGFNGDTVTVDYADLSAAKELFQGKIDLTSENNPALAMTAQLSTDGKNRLLNISIPNIINAEVTLSSSEIEFKELPELAAGEYTEFFGSHEKDSAAWDQFQTDLSGFVHKIMEIELYDNNASGNNGENDPEKAGQNETGLLTDPKEEDTFDTVTKPEESTPDSGAYTEVGQEGQGSAPEVTEASSGTAAETPPVSGGASETPSETVPVTEPSVPETAAPIPTPVHYAPSSLDTGDAQKISGSGLNGFNSGNYYTAEIYVDGGANAGGSITVSELSGNFDDYIRGKVLQIDFADGYEFDSALVVLTFPYDTVSGGRHYPNSGTLKGLDRYLVLGNEDGDEYGDKEIEFYKYSANQIGFIVDRSGYYYVVDMDRYFYEELGVSPEGLAG